jgi:hypothetical protein
VTKRITGKVAALVLAILVLLVSVVPAFAGNKGSSCYTVKDKATGLTTVVCPDGSWD